MMGWDMGWKGGLRVCFFSRSLSCMIGTRTNYDKDLFCIKQACLARDRSSTAKNLL